MSFGSKGSVEELVKSLEKLNNHKDFKCDVTQDGRHWLENGFCIIYSLLLNSKFSYQLMLKGDVLCLLVAKGL